MSKILEKLAICQIVKCIELENVLPKLVRLWKKPQLLHGFVTCLGTCMR